MAELEGPLERVSAEVEVAVLRTEFLSAVTLVLDSERRCVGLVEDLDLCGKNARYVLPIHPLIRWDRNAPSFHWV